MKQIEERNKKLDILNKIIDDIYYILCQQFESYQNNKQ